VGVAELPKCVNFIKKRGCEKSAIRLASENEDHWVFECETCHLMNVVSKPPASKRGQFRAAEEKMRKEAERRRARESRKVFFT
jgi:hypothetical protein